MIIVVGAAQNTGKHSSWGKCKHTGYEVTAYSNRGSRVDVLAPGGEKTKDLGVPDDLNVEIRQSPKAYWESAGLWDIYVEITHNGKLVASGSFDVETGEMGRNIYIYTPV